MGSRRFVIDDECVEMLLQCRNEFLRKNPDFLDMKLSQNFMLKRIMRYYLGEL